MPGGINAGEPIVIAVDGPAASGKGTLARRLAAHYGLHHLDTGLLYRAVGLRALREGMDPVGAAEALTLADLAEPALREDSAAQAAFAGEPPGAVLDGRDIGTVVFPEAPIKIYVDATPEARARRRHEELREMGLASIYTRVLQDMRERDARDRGRAVAPLTLAKDALVIDSSELDADQVFARALAYIGHILPGLAPG